MADTNKATTTTSKVAVIAATSAPVAPDVKAYTVERYGDAKAARKAFNKDSKVYTDAIYATANPTETTAKRVKGLMTIGQAQEAVKSKLLADMTDTQKAAVDKLVEDGATKKDATTAILTYHHNYCLKGYWMMVNLLAEAATL